LHRDKSEITYDILKVLSDGGMPKTRLMMMAILSWNQLKDHLNEMEKLQLLKYSRNSDSKVYMTDKGEAFMNKYDKLMSLFDTRKME
jgi:predicted transcriptional regulator